MSLSPPAPPLAPDPPLLPSPGIPLAGAIVPVVVSKINMAEAKPTLVLCFGISERKEILPSSHYKAVYEVVVVVVVVVSSKVVPHNTSSTCVCAPQKVHVSHKGFVC